MRSRKKRRDARAAGYNKPELHGKHLPRTHGRSELEEGKVPVELDATTSPKELPGDPEKPAAGELGTGSTTEGTATSTTMTET